MTTHQLYNHLNYVNHSREKRLEYANLLLDNPELIPIVLDIMFMVDDKISCRAAWVLEFMCSKNLNALVPYLDRFTTNFHKIHLDSAVRPVAKICEYLSQSYYSKTANTIKEKLTKTHQERIIECSFDYLIQDAKIAPKAYAMNTLYLFGTEYEWIHPELCLILERDYQMQSPGFKARARKILKKIKKTK
ncbi:adenylosuccinate lyase [Bizionia sp. KMM 8389]